MLAAVLLGVNSAHPLAAPPDHTVSDRLRGPVGGGGGWGGGVWSIPLPPRPPGVHFVRRGLSDGRTADGGTADEEEEMSSQAESIKELMKEGVLNPTPYQAQFDSRVRWCEGSIV